MDERIVQLLTVGEVNGSHSQNLLLPYFEELKKQDEGWQMCGDILGRKLHDDDRILFFCLQVMEGHIRARYQNFSNELKTRFKIYLKDWYKQICLQRYETFMKNKTAQIFCLLFIKEYPHSWQSFFHEMLGVLEQGPLAVDIYLRVLISIDEEVVARHIPHTDQEMHRNTMIKDYMRDHCVCDLVESWYQILKLYEQQNEEVVGLCLKVIGAYISWIDINLIANDRFVGNILSYLSKESIRENACDCLLEIVNKGMSAEGKTELIESLSNVLGKTGLLKIDTDDSNVDFIAKLSALLNGMGLQLITSFNKLEKTEQENGLKFKIINAIESKIPNLLRFLCDEDDDVSLAAFEFCHAYLGLLKQLNGDSVVSSHGKYIKDFLLAVISKMKFDEDYDFENESDEEAEFQEFRKQMKILLHSLAKLDGNLIMQSMFELLSLTFNNWQSMVFKDVEVAVYILYCLGECFPGQELYNEPSKFEIFQSMVSLMIGSNISQHPHSAVKLQYFETVARYERFFYAQNQHIPTVLISFLDERGLRSSDASIRSRTSFLLTRFIKSLKSQISPFVEDILQRLQGLLVNIDSSEMDPRLSISVNDRNYLYEVAAILITCSNTSPEKQLQMMQNLFSPILATFQSKLNLMINGQADEVILQNLAFDLHNLMSYASRASKAFSTTQSLKTSGCSSCFKEALNIFLHSLTIPIHRNIIHTGVRQYLHRMIICLGEDVLPFVPVAVTHLLKDCEMRDIQEFIPLINQLITRFKGGIAPFLSEILMPLVTKIFVFIQAPTEENDLQAMKEKQLLQRSYFLFIATIANTNILEVISNQVSNNVQEILLSIVSGAVEIPDPQGQRTCFLIFNKLVEVWGVDDSFKTFIYDSILPSCFLAPLKTTFDLNDAQTVLVLHEIANTLKMALQKRGLEVIQWLVESYLPQNNCPPEIIQQYAQALQGMNIKDFKKYLKLFYTQYKT